LNDNKEVSKLNGENYKKFFKKLPTPTYVWRKIEDDLVLIDYNKAADKIVNGKMKEFLGIKASEFYKDRKDILNDLSQCAMGAAIESREILYNYRTTEENKYLYVTYSGIEPDMVFVHTDDITKQKRAEASLKESEEKFRMISDQSLVAISIAQDGVIKYVNKQLAELSGYSTEEMKSWGPGEFLKIIHPDYRELVAEQSQKKSMGLDDVIDKYEFLGIRKSGEFIWIDNYSKTVTYEGRPAVLSIMIDITEKKKAEKKLKESEMKTRQAYNRAEFYKDLFAHDINNILQNLSSAIEINQERLQKLKGTKKIEEINLLMREQVNRGAKLVSNIRKLTQIEEHKFEFQEVEGLSILKNSISFVKKSFRHRDLNIHIDTHLEKFHLYANELLQEIYDNILINAVKYTVDEPVEIQVKITEEIKNDAKLFKLEFIDHGIGIQDNIKEKIFHRSFTEARSVSGMGLGLSLVKMIVSTFKGEIWVENRIENDYEKGSNFIVLLPEVVKK